jgi:uncharacterized protein involved in exopolysaccharide biosynthesis
MDQRYDPPPAPAESVVHLVTNPSPAYGTARARRAASVLDEEEVSLRELINIFWGGRWLMLAGALLFALGAFAASQIVSKRYQATIIVTPVDEEASGGGALGSLMSSAGSLASLAGLSLGTDEKKGRAIAELQAEELTQDYIRDNNLLPTLYAKLWDPVNRKWKVSDPSKVPTLWKANRMFKNSIRTIEEDKKTGMIKLTIEWKNPQQAATWANGLVKMANDFARTKAIGEAQRSIAYLNEQVAVNNEVEVRRRIYELLESEISKGMIARGREEYSLRVVDPAFAPERASSPQPALWTILGLFGGTVVSAIVVAVRHSMRSDGQAP